MDYSNNDNRRNELKYFIAFGCVALALLFTLAKVAVAQTNEVIVAEAPSNVGGPNGEGVIVYISNSGDSESSKEQTPSVVDVNAPSVGPGSTDPAISIELPGKGIIYTNEVNNQSVDGNIDGNVESEPADNAVIETMEVYVPDSDDDCPVSELVPLDVEVQEYIWTRCKKATGDYKNYYAFMLGAIELESSFKRTAVHHNTNGTVDRGLCQINSCNIKECKKAGLISCAEDLFDIYKNIDCGFHEMNDCINKHGVCENAYYAYNTGKSHGGSNKASRIVMKHMAKWSAVLFPEES